MKYQEPRYEFANWLGKWTGGTPMKLLETMLLK